MPHGDATPDVSDREKFARIIDLYKDNVRKKNRQKYDEGVKKALIEAFPIDLSRQITYDDIAAKLPADIEGINMRVFIHALKEHHRKVRKTMMLENVNAPKITDSAELSAYEDGDHEQLAKIADKPVKGRGLESDEEPVEEGMWLEDDTEDIVDEGEETALEGDEENVGKDEYDPTSEALIETPWTYNAEMHMRLKTGRFPGLEVRQTEGRGRSAYAVCDFKKGKFD